MNYLHNIVHRLMKDKGIKPMEMFNLRYDGLDPLVADSLRPITVGYFDDNYDFHLLESQICYAKAETKDFILSNILNGNIIISPVNEFTPESGDTYYYLESSNPSHPDAVSVRSAVWNDSMEDFARHGIRNCFRSQGDALANPEFYNNALKTYKKKQIDHYSRCFVKVA